MLNSYRQRRNRGLFLCRFRHSWFFNQLVFLVGSVGLLGSVCFGFDFGGFLASNRFKFGSVFDLDFSTIRLICQARFSQLLRTFLGLHSRFDIGFLRLHFSACIASKFLVLRSVGLLTILPLCRAFGFGF